MSSTAGGSDAGGQNQDIEADEASKDTKERIPVNTQEEEVGSRESLEHGFGDYAHPDEEEPAGDEEGLSYSESVHSESVESTADDIPDIVLEPAVSPAPLASPTDSGSIPDDTPSVQGTPVGTPIRSSLSPRSSYFRSPSGALQPFERRFSSRFSDSSLPRAQSPAFLSPHSRQSSVSSQLLSQDGDLPGTPQAPWEVVRWTRLKKITSQAFSEAGKRNFGHPTCLAVSASIVIGTSKGLILVFDYHQTLKSIIGQGTKAVEAGAVTSLAIAADYSTVAGGHGNGSIFTWELSRPAKPFLQIPPVSRPGQSRQVPDGHVPGRAILHVGFLGTRHTALVSADDGGMAFSHLATRGLGAVSRTVKTTRLLGRYPTAGPQDVANRKPSSVLAFASLPLGNVEQPTDTMGLTAMLTPYLLVIVSTTPIAQTQHKSPRPKEITPHSALSGCLAWFPAVKLKTATAGKDVSETKLVYCWSNVLTVLEVESRPQDGQSEKDKLPNLFFHPRRRWKCEEAIVAVQWLSRSVIGVLTISQRLVILEDGALHVMESVDLLQKHIYHQNVFSDQLHVVVEQTENESAMHGVVADAFFMSFRVYKGRLFLLGFNDVAVGTMSNWADRLTALVEHGDDVSAIRLAINYYVGEVGRVAVGLPEDDAARHALVQGRLLELISASLRYTFSQAAQRDPDRLKDLAIACFAACITIDDQSFLFDEVYDAYKDSGEQAVILELLETDILEGEITALPPPVVKDLVDRFMELRQSSRLEELLCRLDPRAFDIDQITRLCKQHNLYDALIFVWNEALLDFVTPLVDLLALVKELKMSAYNEETPDESIIESARKIFAYLAYSLTGRLYPKDEPIDEQDADRVKTDIYRFLFSHQILPWPPGSTSKVRTEAESVDEPPFPYLRLLLQYDSASFMSMLNEAFEDPFLNGVQEDEFDGLASQLNGTTRRGNSSMTRQHIIGILLDIMSDEEFAPEQTIYLDMFIARSLPKYPQFMILSGSALQQVLDRLCTFPSEDLANDCQLSVEYLLSVYHPPVTPELIQLLHDARFYRVLKSQYRSQHQCVYLLQTYFIDPDDKSSIFEDVVQCLRNDVTSRQAPDIKALLCQHAQDLAAIDLPETVRTLSRYAPDILEQFFDALTDSHACFVFLRTLLEPSLLHYHGEPPTARAASDEMITKFGEQYVQLMCIHDPKHVADYIGLLKSGDLRLDEVIPAMEENGIIDAAVLLLAQDGLARDAMDRLVKHMQTLKSAICSLLRAAAETPDTANAEEAATDLTEAIDKYSRIGVWLCQGQTATSSRTRGPRHRTNAVWDVKEDDLDLDEFLWLNLLDAVVSVAKEAGSEIAQLPLHVETIDGEKINNGLRSTVQQTFTALLATTASSDGKPEQDPSAGRRMTPSRIQNHQSFLRVFRAFLTRATLTAPSLSDLRAVLLDIFSAYNYESGVLSLANQLLGRDVFGDVDEARQLRQRGWRPRTQVCEQCKRRAWGPGVGESVWDEWTKTEQERLVDKRKRAAANIPNDDAAGRGKGKANDTTGTFRSEEELEGKRKLALIVFACRHVCHRVCLEGLGRREAAEEGGGGFRCPVCVPDA